MKAAVRKIAPQKALRHCSKEAVGKVSIYVVLVRENTCNQAHIFPEGFC